MASVTLEGISKEFPGGFRAVKDLDLEIRDGEFLVMVGPSGCGKSTTLRLLAGLEQVSEGTIRIGDRVVNDLHPKDRDVAMVFQDYALYPHMTVAGNIGFPLRLARRSKSEIAERVSQTAALLDLTDQLRKKPGQLSGGQRQRVAMGRAIIRTPQVFLLDEPLSNLDAKLRVQMRAEITALQRRVGVTTFYVTHDQTEAMTMADRVAVINGGVLQQVAAPQVLFDKPDNLFVAAFIGSPSMALLEGRLERSGDGLAVEIGRSIRLSAPARLLAERPALSAFVGREVVIGLRPKDLHDVALEPGYPADRCMRVPVSIVEALGDERMVYFAVEAKRVIPDQVLVADGVVTGGAGAIVAARFPARSTAAVGEAIEVGVDVEQAHFFDPATGRSIRD